MLMINRQQAKEFLGRIKSVDDDKLKQAQSSLTQLLKTNSPEWQGELLYRINLEIAARECGVK